MKKLLYSFITISLLFGNSFAWGQENFLLMDYGNLYNLETGEKVWEIKDFYYSIYNKYVIDNNLIILGSNVISSKDLKSGIEKYSNKLNSSIEASIPPAYDEKTKLFVSYFFDRVEKKFNFISFDITGKEIWRIPFPSDYRRLSNGSIIDDTRDVLGIISQNGICYCLTDGTNEGLKLQAIDINNKSVKWTNIVDSLSYRTTRGNSLLQFRGDNIFINYPQNKEGYASLGLEISPNGNILNNLDCYPSIQKVDIDDYFIVGKRFGFFKFYGKLVCYDFENKKINWISPASGYITSKYSFSEKTNSILCTYVDEKNKASILSIDINTGTIKWQREMGVWGGQPVSIVPYEDKIAIFINRSLPVLAKIKIIKFDNPDNILKTFEVAGGSFNYIERIISFGTSPTQTLTLSATTQNALATASNANITLNTNNNWTASSNAPWLKVSPTSGNAGANLAVNFTIDANTTANARTGIVTFTAGALTQTYTVTQAGAIAPVLTISATAQNVVATANATGSSITLTANNTWTASSNVAWLKVNPASGNAGTNLAVNFPIEANTATTTRTGIVTFTSGGLTQTYTVTQAGTVTPTLTISVAAQNIGANATTSNLTLTANNSWTASSNASWLKVSPTSGNAGTNLAVNFTIDSNNSTVERTGIITFTAGGLTKTYTVTQAGTVAPILTISVSSQNVVSTASTTNITLTSNNTWTASSNATWLKVSPAIGNNGANLTINFTIDANTTANARTGIVSFVAGGLTQTYTVTQAGQAPLTFTFLQPLGNQQVLPKSILSVKGTGEWANEISFSIGIYEKATSKLIQQLSTNTSTQQLKDGINYTLNDLAPAQYDLKVQGNNQKTLIGSVVIEIVNNASTIDLLWDYETNRTLSNKKPLGVAADGTARLLLKITPNATVASRVKKITAELQNPTNSTIISSSYLGKIMATNKTNNTYSDEASNITTTSASNIFTTTDNSYYFWYVAPDDFADKIIDDLVNGERKVRCKITLYDAANTVLNSAEPTITVVRPPLALVHGLGGDPTSYDNFGYGATSASILFKDDTRFKTRKALKVYPNDTFEANANLLLGKDNTNMDNSLPYLINDLRAKGYACNRVDYVGHSMGGCMLRYATQLNDWKSNLNYNKGYVNKFVTLDTPHQGSPLGDIVNEFAPFIPIENEKLYSLATLMGKVSSFITANNFSQIATPAVQNLSLRESNGGIKLKETEIKNHEIIGDYVKDFNPPHLALVTGGDISGTLVGLPILANALSDGAIKKFKQCANCVAEYNAVQEMKSYALTDYHFTKEFLNWQAKRVAGLNNFFQSSDIIVSTESQSAGLLSQKLPSQTVVMASHSFGKSSVLSSSQAGNKVNSLLNATISSNLFADVIPATKSITTPYSCGTSDCKTANNRLAYVQLDTTKIKIISPLRGGITLAAGSNLTIQVQLKDTTGYRFLEVNMGLLRQRTNEKKGIVSITIQVPSDIIGKQYLSVKGVYRDKNGNYQEYEDNVNLTVQTIEQPQAVQVIPTSLKLNVGKSDTLKFVATYAKSQSLWLAPYNNITAEYDNALLSIDTKTMTITGKKAGKTTIILTISNGNKYNVAVEIIQPPIILATEPIANNQENQVIIFPNPTTNEVTVKYRLQTAAFVKIELFDLQGHLLNGLFDGKQNVNEYNLKIDFSKYPVGEYLLKFQIGEEKISKKVIKL